jgi:hypothetical protein
MKRLQLLATLMIVLCVFALMLTIGDFLALHDISRDYVSGRVLQSLGLSLAGQLPSWTDTKAEWVVVGVSVFFRVGFLLLNTMTLALCVRALKQRATTA